MSRKGRILAPVIQYPPYSTPTNSLEQWSPNACEIVTADHEHLVDGESIAHRERSMLRHYDQVVLCDLHYGAAWFTKRRKIHSP